MSYDDRLWDRDPSAFSALVHGEWPVPDPPNYDTFRFALETDASSFGVLTHRWFFEAAPWCMNDDVCDGVPSSEPFPIRYRPFAAGDGPGCGQKRFLFICDCWRSSPDYDRLWDSIHTTGFDPSAFVIPTVRMRSKEYAKPNPDFDDWHYGRALELEAAFGSSIPPATGVPPHHTIRVTVWIGQCEVCGTIYWAAE